MHVMYKKQTISFLSIPHITSMTTRELSTVRKKCIEDINFYSE